VTLLNVIDFDSDIQKACNASYAGDTILVPDREFLVDALISVIPKAGTILQIDGVIRAIPNAATNYNVISVEQDGVTIVLNGAIEGERYQHQGGTGEWGHGIRISANHVKVTGNGQVRDCWGDGIYVSGAKSVLIEGITASKNRRQGLSVIDVDGLTVSGASFLDTGGTAPGAGIDLEVDNPDSQSIRNVQITGCRFSGNQGASVLVATPPRARSNIHIFGNTYNQNQPIDGTDGVVPFWAKWFYYVTKSYQFYPKELHIP
jgi:polygalacturonase